MPVTAYIAIGSNLGDKMGACRKALDLLARSGRITRVSSFYCTEPVGYADQEDFVNVVAEIETGLSPLALLAACHVVEDELGRERLVRWGPRTMDLDILLYGDRVIDGPELTVPHPRLGERGFVLVPLAEIAARVMHPVAKKTIARLLRDLQDPHRVTRCAPGDLQQP